MFIKPLILSLSLFALPNNAAAQETTCQSRQLTHEMRNIEKYYRSADLELFVIQMMLRGMERNQHLQADGLWGPDTYKAICSALTTIHAIGTEPINTQSDVREFGQWIIVATRASMNPRVYEFPD